MTDLLNSQSGAEVITKGPRVAQVSQVGIEFAYKIDVPLNASQVGAEVMFRIAPPCNISQTGVEVMYKAMPCTTKRAQIWTITRTDGQVYRFTSLDRTLNFAGLSYQACASLDASATESMAEVGGAGNFELSGLVASGAISAEELMAGLFDGARVDAFLVPWQGNAPILPLLKGTFSKVDFSKNGFRAEILGDGARLEQTPLIQTLQPNCRWQFGDSRCGVNLTPLKVTGSVDSPTGQRGFTDAARTEAAGYFTRGRVTFLTGDNAGISAEIKQHSTGGVFTLWPRLAFPIAVGDTYEMVPGCTNLPEDLSGTRGCNTWGNFVNFGGFPDVPGSDIISRSADVRPVKGGS